MRTMEHVERMESGGMVCRHCGGMVDEEGYATGGEAEDSGESLHDGMDEESEQSEATERMRDAAFADAVKRRRSE